MILHRLPSRLLLGGALALGCFGVVRAAPPAVTAGLANGAADAESPLFPIAVPYARMRADVATPVHGDHRRLRDAYLAAVDGRHDHSMTPTRQLPVRGSNTSVRYQAALLAANLSVMTGEYSLGLEHLALASGLEPVVDHPTLRDSALAVAANLFLQLDQAGLALDHEEQLLARSLSAQVRCSPLKTREPALPSGWKAHTSDADFESVVEQCRGAGEPIAMHLVQVTHARQLAEAGDRVRALRLLEVALPVAETTGHGGVLAEIHSAIAELHLAQGDRAGAEAAARRVVALEGTERHSKPVLAAHYLLYEAAEARGEYALALAHYRRFHELEQAYLVEVKARTHAAYLNSAESVTQRRQAQVLAQHNKSLKLQQDAAIQRAWTFRLGVVSLGILAAVFGYWGWQYQRTHKALRRLGEIDPLTGVSNRRHFREACERVLAQCEKSGRPMGMLLIDLDHFKQINDQCGQAVGDWILREVARIGNAFCGDGFLLGRVGGEEFAMALPACDAQRAMRIGDELGEAIRSMDALAGGCFLPVTASIGVAGTAQSSYNFQRLIGEADRAMHTAKLNKRDSSAFGARDRGDDQDGDNRHRACG